MFFFAYIISLVTSSFLCDTWDEAPYTENLNIDAESISDCKNSSLIIFNAGTIKFSPGTFDGFNNLIMLLIKASKKATFSKSSLCNLPKLRTLSVGESEDTLVQFLDQSATNNTALTELIIVGEKLTIGYESFKDCSNMEKVGLELLSYDFGSSAFCNCGLTKDNFDIKHFSEVNHTEDKCYLECCSKNDDGSSSRSENDNDSENINIESVYFGTYMPKLKNRFDRAAPSYNFVRYCIWVGPKDVKDNSIGTLFLYGAKGRIMMTFADFKKKFSATKTMKLDIHKNFELNGFIKEIKESENSKVNDYNWQTNKYQHLIAKLIGNLQATRDAPSSKD